MSDSGVPSLAHTIHTLREQLGHLERLAGSEVHAISSAEHAVGRAAEDAVGRATDAAIRPTWQLATAGEQRLPVALVILVAIGLQLALPSHLSIHPIWLLPALEGALLVGLTAANPRRIDRTSRALRGASIFLIALTSIANAFSSAQLINGLIHGTEGSNAGALLANGAAIYLTNIIVFGLWYWEWDRGGPVARALAPRRFPDFLFPQMANPDLAAPEWRPNFVDYLYVSFTNAAAFSPTDTMPLSRWAKMLMLLQSAVALATVALVVARAVNILK
ncbi:MAG: hypothetical protein ACR2KC_03995 [Acidimicrobiales bacterium]